jgi:ribonucleoside-diphosphate reductase alpha chain
MTWNMPLSAEESQKQEHKERTAEAKAATVKVRPHFMKHRDDPFDAIDWETRSATITNPQTGEKVFEGADLEFPRSWSQNTVALVAEKYFRAVLQPDGTRMKETSVRQMVGRVADTISRWGVELGYLEDFTPNGKKPSARTFRNELAYVLVHQMVAFNSPVWFNVGAEGGVRGTEQASACFINSVQDEMSSILELAKTEGMLYKGGSGSGVNYSLLRSSRERLSGGGFASGPVPFLAKDDLNAGAIKSGGTTRRAAKMAILNIDHGDIREFIQCKVDSERAVSALVSAGFDADFRARWGASAMVPFQNANHSIRVSDRFMRAVEADDDWNLMTRTGGEVLETTRARDLWTNLCHAAHLCGDPGLQFDTTINDWHTVPKDGRIDGSNPCSEFMHLDDSACNLASINFLAFLDENNEFDIDGFHQTIDVLVLAMDILVDAASYPTPQIATNSHKTRPLGLGFTNLGAYLMAQGIPYDSDLGRQEAAALTAILTGRAYSRSAEIAAAMGTFETFEANRDDMMRVMRKHHKAAHRIPSTVLGDQARDDWDQALALGEAHGYRNSQASVVAPAGTISFLMDCDTTGIEPELALVKTKKLVGGGTIQIVNQQLKRALQALDYQPEQIETILAYVLELGSAVNSGVRPEHVEIFDASMPDPIGGRYLRPEAHIGMMAAVQPFVSGAISKTVNVPSDATVEDIQRLYRLSWEQGLKSVAIYRDGCKQAQPLETKREDDAPQAVRHKMPTDCLSHRHKFRIGAHKGYIHVGLYRDQKPGEVFIKMAKEGSTVSGLMDTVATMTSYMLQFGVPLRTLVDKFSYTNFEPAGMTNYKPVQFAKSPVDYLFRWLGAEFLGDGADEDNPHGEEPVAQKLLDTGLLCSRCGNLAQRAGTCMTCSTCGWSEGCG